MRLAAYTRSCTRAFGLHAAFAAVAMFVVVEVRASDRIARARSLARRRLRSSRVFSSRPSTFDRLRSLAFGRSPAVARLQRVRDGDCGPFAVCTQREPSPLTRVCSLAAASIADRFDQHHDDDHHNRRRQLTTDDSYARCCCLFTVAAAVAAVTAFMCCGTSCVCDANEAPNYGRAPRSSLCCRKRARHRG